MLRLFVSLYFAIVIGIFAINWASESIWQQLNHSHHSEISSVKTLTQHLAKLITHESQLSDVSESKFNITRFDLNDIAWMPEQLSQLNQGNAITLYDSEDNLFVVALTSSANQALKVGPLNAADESESLKLLILLISYTLLAVIIALWTRPIWNDLSQLEQVAKAINNHQEVTTELTNKSSAISSVVQTVNQMAKRIQSLLNEQKQLVNAVSHELRTPLSRLRFSFALLENVDKKQQQNIEQDISEIETLIDEMLSYSRIEYIAQQQPKDKVNINELLSRQIEKHQRGSNKKLNANLDKSLSVFGNHELLERAFQNLITNGLRYATKTVLISAHRQGQNIIINVEDDGEGIPDDQKKTLFNPFTRVDKSRNKTQGGYGLGLAIVKKAIDWHYGDYHIEDSPLGGAHFKITIPIN